MSETSERTGIQPYMQEPDSDPEQEETTAEVTIMRMNQDVLEWYRLNHLCTCTVFHCRFVTMDATSRKYLIKFSNVIHFNETTNKYC